MFVMCKVVWIKTSLIYSLQRCVCVHCTGLHAFNFVRLCVSVLWLFTHLCTFTHTHTYTQIVCHSVYTNYSMFVWESACFCAWQLACFCMLFTHLCTHNAHVVFVHICVWAISPWLNTHSNRAHWDTSKSTVTSCKLTRVYVEGVVHREL